MFMTRTEVVETVSGRTMAELLAARDRASAGLVELRLDGVEDLDVAGALRDRTCRVIVTCRPTWEGGLFDGGEETRLRRLSEAVRLGAEFVDVEWRADRSTLASGTRTEVVLSHHDFAGVPVDLADRVRAMQREGASVVKVAVMPTRLSDCLVLGDAMRMSERHVAIAMGPMGQVTRLCPWVFGSCWTYGGTVAPGQVTARELIDRYRVPQATTATAIYAVAGAPLAHSASPAMHNAAFAALGLDAVYVPLETGDGDELLAVAEAIGLVGASVTAPLKVAAFARSRPADDVAARTGSVNTLRRRPDGWDGRNFDVAGFLAPLRRRNRDLNGTRAVVLGAGGSARTAAWALKQEGAKVEVAARHAARGQTLADDIGVAATQWPPSPGWDLLVNTTPVGTWPHVDEAPIGRDAVAGGTVYDLIYNPRETTLVRWAREAGMETIDGLEMLVGQARLQFEWWTGREAPAATMEEAAEAFIAERRQRTA
jgi:3-dehydroquinate dehydratase / shikimate dehydrogenase